MANSLDSTSDDLLGLLRNAQNDAKSLYSQRCVDINSIANYPLRRVKFKTSKKHLISVCSSVLYTNGCDHMKEDGSYRRFLSKYIPTPWLGIDRSRLEMGENVMLDIDAKSTYLPVFCKILIVHQGAVHVRSPPILARDVCVQVDKNHDNHVTNSMTTTTSTSFSHSPRAYSPHSARPRSESKEKGAAECNDHRGHERRTSWGRTTEYYSPPHYQYLGKSGTKFDQSIQVCDSNNRSARSNPTSPLPKVEALARSYTSKQIGTEDLQDYIGINLWSKLDLISPFSLERRTVPVGGRPRSLSRDRQTYKRYRKVIESSTGYTDSLYKKNNQSKVVRLKKYEDSCPMTGTKRVTLLMPLVDANDNFVESDQSCNEDTERYEEYQVIDSCVDTDDIQQYIDINELTRTQLLSNTVSLKNCGFETGFAGRRSLSSDSTSSLGHTRNHYTPNQQHHHQHNRHYTKNPYFNGTFKSHSTANSRSSSPVKAQPCSADSDSKHGSANSSIQIKAVYENGQTVLSNSITRPLSPSPSEVRVKFVENPSFNDERPMSATPKLDMVSPRTILKKRNPSPILKESARKSPVAFASSSGPLSTSSVVQTSNSYYLKSEDAQRIYENLLEKDNMANSFSVANKNEKNTNCQEDPAKDISDILERYNIMHGGASSDRSGGRPSRSGAKLESASESEMKNLMTSIDERLDKLHQSSAVIKPTCDEKSLSNSERRKIQEENLDKLIKYYDQELEKIMNEKNERAAKFKNASSSPTGRVPCSSHLSHSPQPRPSGCNDSSSTHRSLERGSARAVSKSPVGVRFDTSSHNESASQLAFNAELINQQAPGSSMSPCKNTSITVTTEVPVSNYYTNQARYPLITKAVEKRPSRKCGNLDPELTSLGSDFIITGDEDLAKTRFSEYLSKPKSGGAPRNSSCVDTDRDRRTSSPRPIRPRTSSEFSNTSILRNPTVINVNTSTDKNSNIFPCADFDDDSNDDDDDLFGKRSNHSINLNASINKNSSDCSSPRKNENYFLEKYKTVLNNIENSNKSSIEVCQFCKRKKRHLKKAANNPGEKAPIYAKTGVKVESFRTLSRSPNRNDNCTGDECSSIIDVLSSKDDTLTSANHFAARVNVSTGHESNCEGARSAHVHYRINSGSGNRSQSASINKFSDDQCREGAPETTNKINRYRRAKYDKTLTMYLDSGACYSSNESDDAIIVGNVLHRLPSSRKKSANNSSKCEKLEQSRKAL